MRSHGSTPWMAAALLLLSVAADSQDAGPPRPAPLVLVASPGLVFNLAADLQGLESYQGGIGAKIAFGPHGVRLRFEDSYSSATGAFVLGLGVLYEYHLAVGQVSPYVGLSVDAGYFWDGESTTAIPLAAGAVVGVEIFPLYFLSFFVEYAAAVDFTAMRVGSGEPSETYATVGTRMGNMSRVGVVVYMSRQEVRSGQ